MTARTITVQVNTSSSNTSSEIHVAWSATAYDRAALERLRELADRQVTHARITRVPGRMGGAPIVDGMRVRVSDVVREQRMLGDPRIAMPFLTSDQIRVALHYYHAHRAEIDAEIASEDQAAEQCRPDSI